MSLFGASIGGSALGRVLVEVGLDARPLEAGMAQTKGSVAKGATGIGSTFKTAVKAGAILAGAAVIKFGADSVKAFIASEEAGQRLGNSLKNNAKLSDVSTQSWQDQAHALQELTGIQDVEITSAQAMLGQFDLTGTQVQALIPLVVDLSQKMGIDLSTAVKAVGKATAGNTGSLQRFGIIVDKGKDGIAGFGDVVSALQGKVGGFSESISGNFQTRMKVLAANFKDVEEEVGKALIPVLQGLASALNQLMPLISLAAQNWQLLLGVFLGFKAMGFLTGLFAKLNFALNGLSTASTVAGKAVQAAATSLAALGTLGTAGVLADIAVGFEDIHLAVGLITGDRSSFEKYTKVVGDGFKSNTAAGRRWLDTILGVLPAQQRQIASTKTTTLAANELGRSENLLVGRLDASAGSARNLTGSTAALAAAHRKASQAALDQLNTESELAGTYLGVRTAAAQVAQDQGVLNKLRSQGKTSTDAYRAALVQALNDEGSLVAVVDKYRGSAEGATGATKAVNAVLIAYGRSVGATKGQIAGLVSQTDAEITRADQLANKLNSLPKQTDINVTVHYATTGNPNVPGTVSPQQQGGP